MTEKGIEGLTITYDSFDEAVVSQMKSFVEGILKDPWPCHHNYKESLKDVDSFLRVIDFFSNPGDYDVYKKVIESQYDSLVTLAHPPSPVGPMEINILNIRDLPDGGSNVEYEVNHNMKEFLMGVGMLKILEDAVKDTEDRIREEGISKEVDNDW